MTRRRWIADEVSGNRASLLGRHAEHLSKVLRARPGQEFDLSISGILRRGRIVAIDHNRVDFELGEEIPAASVSDVTLLLSVFKFDRMEWAIEKCTELGAARIVPVIAQRTEKYLAAAAEKRWDRWRRLARQAAEQSRRLGAPEMVHPLPLKDAIPLCAGKKIVLSEIEQGVLLKDIVAGSPGATLAFGPEGGWTEGELTQFGETGWTSASLGGTILRAETAAIAGLAIALAVMSG